MCKLHCTLWGAMPVTNWYSGALAVLIVLALVFRLFRPGASFIHAWGCRHKRCPESIELFGFLVLIRAAEITWSEQSCRWYESRVVEKAGWISTDSLPSVPPTRNCFRSVSRAWHTDSESYVTYEPELVPLCQRVNSQWRTSLKYSQAHAIKLHGDVNNNWKLLYWFALINCCSLAAGSSSSHNAHVF